MAWLPVSPLWRNLRKISAVHLFTKHRLDATQVLRHKKVQELLEYVGDCCRNVQAVDIGRAAFTTTLNLFSNTFFSIDLASHSSEESQMFLDLAHAIMGILGKPNLADFFPILSYLDPFGVRGDAEVYFGKMFAVFDDIIKQRLSTDDPSSLSTEDDVLATLLKISKEDGSDLSRSDIKHLLLDLFAAGTDTTSSTLEWAMTELLRNPEEMAKLQGEVLGEDSLIQESDIERLPYLQAVIKETLRIHPPAPLLVPHKCENEVSLCGYVVPKDTQLQVNIWL